MGYLEKLKPLALLFLRCALGIVFITHGYPKLFGDTKNLIATFTGLGLPWWTVYLAGVIEVFGGGLLILGLFTRFTGLLLTLHMGVAMWKYNLSEGLQAVRQYELPLVLAAAAFALATLGAGAISLDYPIFGRRRPKTKSR